MRQRLDELAAARKQREAEARERGGANAQGGWARGTPDTAKGRTGRRGNR